ncbi:MAG: DUF1559 domain-containing protein [Planctomycetaceae bacterium]|nr:DUF1559 domain-containing protein [Planctomycetaceae bacterium]
MGRSPKPKFLGSFFGFTLVELLVVIAIIGVLIAILLPAVQAARNAASRAACQSNMKNIALAFHNHNDVNERYPLGFDRWVFATWAIYTLPFLEQEALYASYNQRREYNSGALDAGFTKSNLNLLRNLRIPIYTCPGDGDKKSTYDNFMHHNYVVCMGNAGVYHPNTSGCGWAIYGDVTQLQGAMFWGGHLINNGGSWVAGYKYISLADVTDGLSNTVALSETIQGERSTIAGGISNDPLDLRGLIWWSETTLFTTYRSPNTTIADNLDFSNSAYSGGGTMHEPQHPIAPVLSGNIIINSARSFHAGGVNSAIGDGSVRFINDTINIDVWRAIGTTQGDEPISIP